MVDRQSLEFFRPRGTVVYTVRGAVSADKYMPPKHQLDTRFVLGIWTATPCRMVERIMWLPCAGSSLGVEQRINQPRAQAKHSLSDAANRRA